MNPIILIKYPASAADVRDFVGRRVQTQEGIAFISRVEIMDKGGAMQLIDAETASRLPQHIQRHIHGEAIPMSDLTDAGWIDKTSSRL